MLNARLRKRWLRGGFTVGAIGPALDLTFPVTVLGAGPADARRARRGRHDWAETLKAAKHPMLILGQGALRRPDGAAILALARALRRERWAWCARTGTASTCCTRRRRGSAGSISASCRGRAGAMSRGILAGCETGEIDAVYLLGADEIDMRRLGTRLRHLSGPSRRRRRAPRRRRAAGRRLYREGRDLRQHRGPRPARPPRRLPAGRCARGLEDPARACPRRWARRCPTIRCAALRAAHGRASIRCFASADDA